MKDVVAKMYITAISIILIKYRMTGSLIYMFPESEAQSPDAYESIKFFFMSKDGQGSWEYR